MTGKERLVAKMKPPPDQAPPGWVADDRNTVQRAKKYQGNTSMSITPGTPKRVPLINFTSKSKRGRYDPNRTNRSA